MGFMSIQHKLIIVGRFEQGIDMLGARLKIARTRGGHTQSSLAEMMNTDARQIWRWENGETSPSADVIVRIAQTLSVSADYLLGLTDDPTPATEKFNELSEKERVVLSAWRHGDYRQAIRVMVNDE